MKLSQTFLPLCFSALLLSNALGAHAMPMKSMMKTSPTDAKYLQDNAQGSTYDYATAQLAVQKATDPALYRYGLMLLDDHARLNKMLGELAHQRHLSLPLIMEDKDQQSLQGLMTKNGAAFDKAIVAEFVKINATDVRDGLKELSVTKDPQVKRIVTEFVRIEKRHLSGARALQAKMKA